MEWRNLSPDAVATLLEQFRVRNRMSMRALAKFLGLYPSTTFSLLQGRREPHPTTLERVASKIPVEASPLPGWQDAPPRLIPGWSRDDEILRFQNALARRNATLDPAWLALQTEDARQWFLPTGLPAFRLLRTRAPYRPAAERVAVLLGERLKPRGKRSKEVERADVVMLAAGDGEVASKLCQELSRFGLHHATVSLVDTSAALLRQANNRLLQVYERTRQVEPLLGPFTPRLPCLSGDGRPRLVCLLGDALGRMPDETAFFSALVELSEGDLLLLEITMHGPEPSPDEGAPVSELVKHCYSLVLERNTCRHRPDLLTTSIINAPASDLAVPHASGRLVRAVLTLPAQHVREYELPLDRTYDVHQLCAQLGARAGLRLLEQFQHGWDSRRFWLLFRRQGEPEQALVSHPGGTR